MYSNQAMGIYDTFTQFTQNYRQYVVQTGNQKWNPQLKFLYCITRKVFHGASYSRKWNPKLRVSFESVLKFFLH